MKLCDKIIPFGDGKIIKLDRSRIREYSEYLLDEEFYLYPTKKEVVYTKDERSRFFGNSTRQLEGLLSCIKPKKHHTSSCDEQIIYNLTVVSHGQTDMNRANQLSGWSGSMLANSYIAENKFVLGGIEQAMIQAGYEKKRITHDIRTHLKNANPEEIAKAVHSVPFFGVSEIDFVFSGDLARQLDHALLLTGKEEVFKELENMRKHFTADLSCYKDLMSLAVDQSIIPTPLLRAQYYSFMEMQPEKISNKKRFVGNMVTKLQKTFPQINKAKALQEATDLVDALEKRKEIMFTAKDDHCNYITEDRVDLTKRLQEFADLTIKYTKNRKILAVTSSGCEEVIPQYFRYLENPREVFIIEKPKTKVRGKVTNILFGTYLHKPYYLNDQKKLDKITKKTMETAENLRKLSLDELIRKGEGLIDIVLRSCKTNDKSSSPFTLQEILVSSKPTIIYGYGGQGKTILATQIAEYAINQGVVPVLMNCQSINITAERYKNLENTILGESGISVLNSILKKSTRFAFILDDFQKTSSDYLDQLQGAVQKIHQAGNTVVLLARRNLPVKNLANYLELEIDTVRLAESYEDFAKTRIPQKDYAGFMEFISQYDTSVKGNLMALFFVTAIYPGSNGNHDAIFKYITKENQHIIPSIKQGTPLSKLDIYNVMVDYQIGKDLKTQNPSWPLEMIHDETISIKDHLARMAFVDSFPTDKHHGKKTNYD